MSHAATAEVVSLGYSLTARPSTTTLFPDETILIWTFLSAAKRQSVG
jgi:hypothetical protein